MPFHLSYLRFLLLNLPVHFFSGGKIVFQSSFMLTTVQPLAAASSRNLENSLAKLDKGLDEAAAKGWTVVSMKDDWKTIFPPEKK